MSLDIRDEAVDGVRVIALAGRLDTETAADLELAAQDFVDAGDRRFVIDLAGVGYVSSAGLRVLLKLAKSLEGGGALALSGLNASVRQVFDVAGFSPLFTIAIDRGAALSRVAGAPSRPASAPASPQPSPAAAPPASRPAPAPSPVASAPTPTLADAASRLLDAKPADGKKADPALVDKAGQLLGAGRKS
ncbi:STAS domain-containing protein [Dokdonella sp. MW10]|uniref:STAS domain-containing protein n=1 Tax=Dokdonella sp. MW10 TaxID=2992926 RepID=UPI003F7F2FE8